ncbi:arginase family protein [Edaphobacter aggregans]|uniref:arginase family protein n=1 Tax=Edaphobacter aggregans TaxID=570835 RepID=UPI00054FAB5F|nr:arginase family protein [Edaphobacter aggregans]
MSRSIAILGAPSSIGIRPYDNGETRQLNRTPGVLRELGLVQHLGASDLGDVIPPAYRDYVRPPGWARNEAEVTAYCRMLGERVEAATSDRRFAVVLGGDCSIVLGCLLGARRSAQGPVGLVYVDAHADFATPEESRTGSVASMCLALAVGRGETPLARLAGGEPLVHGKDVVLIGRRDAAQPWYGHAALAASSILDIPGAALTDRGVAGVAAAALLSLTSSGSSKELRGFWIHLDADVINPTVMPAVDSPEPGGPTINEVVELLTPLVCHPQALGLEVTIYDPGLDPDRTCAARLVTLLENLLLSIRSLDTRTS